MSFKISASQGPTFPQQIGRVLVRLGQRLIGPYKLSAEDQDIVARSPRTGRYYTSRDFGKRQQELAARIGGVHWVPGCGMDPARSRSLEFGAVEEDELFCETAKAREEESARMYTEEEKGRVWEESPKDPSVQWGRRDILEAEEGLRERQLLEEEMLEKEKAWEEESAKMWEEENARVLEESNKDVNIVVRSPTTGRLFTKKDFIARQLELARGTGVRFVPGCASDPETLARREFLEGEERRREEEEERGYMWEQEDEREWEEEDDRELRVENDRVLQEEKARLLQASQRDDYIVIRSPNTGRCYTRKELNDRQAELAARVGGVRYVNPGEASSAEVQARRREMVGESELDRKERETWEESNLPLAEEGSRGKLAQNLSNLGRDFDEEELAQKRFLETEAGLQMETKAKAWEEYQKQISKDNLLGILF